MKLIIGSGFLGSALAGKLAEKERVRVVSRSSSSPLCGKPNIEFFQGDFRNLDWEVVLKDIDVVYTMNATILSYDGTEGIVKDIHEGIIPMLALVSDVLDHLEAKNGFRSDGFTMSM